MKRNEIQKISCDLLIIGGGAASCMAAIEASKYELNTILADKGFFGRSGSNPTSGGWGVAAAFGHIDTKTGKRIKNDGSDTHFADSMKGGEFLNEKKIVKVVVEEITQRIIETESFGVHYCKTPDHKFFYQRGGGGHSFARVCYGGTGWDLMESIAKETLFRRIRVIDNFMVIKILVSDEIVTGALAVNLANGKLYIFECSAIIIGAGSATGLYKYSSANFLSTGDSFAMVFDLNVEFNNMEFV